MLLHRCQFTVIVYRHVKYHGCLHWLSHHLSACEVVELLLRGPERLRGVLTTRLQKRKLVSEILGLAAAALRAEYLCLRHCSTRDVRLYTSHRDLQSHTARKAV